MGLPSTFLMMELAPNSTKVASAKRQGKLTESSTRFSKGKQMNCIRLGSIASASLLVAGLVTTTDAARAFGDDGHQTVALIADHFLTPAVRAKVAAILATDAEPFRMRDGRMTNASFATQATWADYYRDSQGKTGEPYRTTHQWHFVDVEIAGGSLIEACSNYPALPADTPASEGTPDDCVVDKISQFADELASPATPDDERLRALKFLLHYVGDVHQPLHASDDHDAGGNGKNVTAVGFKGGSLHHFWDNEFVLRIGANPEAISKTLIKRITKAQMKQWSSPDPKKWATESYSLAKRKAYGALPVPVHAHTGSGTSYRLTQDYVDDAVEVTGVQLSKAGVRLAAVLTQALQ